MVKRLFLIALMVMVLLPVGVQAKKRVQNWGSGINYQIETLNSATMGNKLVKSWGQSKKLEDAIQVAMKNAVSAAVFQGLPAGPNALATPALCKGDEEVAHKEYFDKFFSEGGAYLLYANRVSTSVPAGRDNMKAGNQRRVGISVNIKYDALRAQLERDRIIHGLNRGF